MARILENQHFADLNWGIVKDWVYNGLDCCVTREVFDVLSPRLGEGTKDTYAFERGMQAPAMQMMLRGVLVDETARLKAITDLRHEEVRIGKQINSDIGAVWDVTERRTGKCTIVNSKTGKIGNHKWDKEVPEADRRCAKCGLSYMIAKEFNPISSDQVMHILYGLMGLPKQYSRKANKYGERPQTADDGALEHLAGKFPSHSPLLDLILEARGVRKQIGFLGSKIGPDGRMRSSFNVGAAETFRWSSSKSPYMDGTNLQNIADRSRNIFVSDPGKWLVYADLEQAESNVVAHQAEDVNYIQAHKSGDVHTFVCKQSWPDRPWSGDPKGDRAVADEPASWDKNHELRWYAKHIQHGSNLGMTPHGMAHEMRSTVAFAREVQELYFAKFPGVRAEQRRVDRDVQELGYLVNPLGVRKQFFGRLWDKHTMKEGYAFIPQSMVAFILSMGLWRVWKEMDPQGVELLAQIHDAILGQVADVDGQPDPVALRRIKQLMTFPCLVKGRAMTIEVDVMVGKNFGKAHGDVNPDGLRKWKDPL